MTDPKKLYVPNYTQLPNPLVDDWLKIISKTEYILATVIARKTIGWHKLTDPISISQMQEITGYAKHTIIDALRSLEARGLVEVIRTVLPNGEHLPNTYTLTLYEPDSDEDTGGSAKNALPSAGIALGGSAGIAHTKERTTKEKELTPDLHREDNPPALIDEDDVYDDDDTESEAFRPSSLAKDSNVEEWANQQRAKEKGIIANVKVGEGVEKGAAPKKYSLGELSNDDVAKYILGLLYPKNSRINSMSEIQYQILHRPMMSGAEKLESAQFYFSDEYPHSQYFKAYLAKTVFEGMEKQHFSINVGNYLKFIQNPLWHHGWVNAMKKANILPANFSSQLTLSNSEPEADIPEFFRGDDE